VRTRNRILLRVLYWLAVLVVSIALLIGLILLLESRDSSSVGGTVQVGSATAPARS
jgi:preprotein translocase subunit SecG